MKLVACKSCNHAIDRRAMKCPQCGAPRKTGSGLFKIIVLSVFIGFVLVCMLGSLSGKKSSTPTASSPVNTPKPQPVAISTPHTNVSPAKPTVQPIVKPVKQPDPPVQTTQVSTQLVQEPVRDLDAELAMAKNNVALAQAEVEKAKTDAIKRLHQTPEYKAALQEVADTTKKVEDDKISGSPTLVESSKKKLEAKSKLAKMEAEATANDPALKSSQSKVVELNKSVEAIQSEIANRDAQRRAEAIKLAEAERAKQIEAEKIAADEKEKQDTLHVGYTSYRVWSVRWSNHISDNEFLDKRANADWLIINISVRNNDNKARMIPPIVLIDEQGRQYESAAEGMMLDDAIGLLEELNPTVTKQGNVYFDVPKGRKYKLKLSGGFWSTDTGYIALDSQ